MFNFTSPANQILSPPELPTYLKDVHDLKSITGVPSDNEIAAIHAVIRVANRVVDEGVGDPRLHAQLLEHLFEAQITRYQSKYPCELLKDTTYTPPVLPSHVSVNLEPVSGSPSEDQLMKVHEALRSYGKYSEIPSMFDPRINAELSQHLFDIQMAKFVNNTGQDRPSFMPQEATPPPAPTSTMETGSIEQTINLAEELTASGINNNRAGVTYERMGPQPKQEPQAVPRCVHDVHLRDALQRSNQLVGGLAEILGNINGVLVGIQHTMIRGQFRDDAEYNVRQMGRMVNHRGDTIEKMDFLTRAHRDDPSSIKIHIRGQGHSIYVPDTRLAVYLKFYGLEEGLCYEDHSILQVKEESERRARERLGSYLSGRVG